MRKVDGAGSAGMGAHPAVHAHADGMVLIEH